MGAAKYLLFCFVLSCIECDAGLAQSYSYDAWVDEKITIETPSANETKGFVTLGADGRAIAEFCPSHSDYFCVFSPLYAFAVPKRIDPDVRSWTVNNLKFGLVRTGIKMSIFGREMDDLIMIATPADATAAGRQSMQSSWSLYSPKFGLIGFRTPRSLPVYWAVGSVGFAARNAETVTD